MHTTIDTEIFPAAQRLSIWRELISARVMPVKVDTRFVGDFLARASVVDLGAVQVSEHHVPTLESWRTPAMIVSDDPESYLLLLGRSGQATLTQGGLTVALQRHECALFDTSRPFHIVFDGPADRCSVILVRVPRTLLPLQPSAAQRLTGVSLTARRGVGALLSQHLVALLRHTDSYQLEDAARLGTITVDLLVAVLAHELDHSPDLFHAVNDGLLARIDAFIDENLGDPGLSPQTIASAHHVSTRSLHRIFQARELTVAELVRNRRLDRCRHDLVDPLLREEHINAIAMRWGLPSQSHFSRIFRAAYGMSPQEYRHKYAGGRQTTR